MTDRAVGVRKSASNFEFRAENDPKSVECARCCSAKVIIGVKFR